MRAADIPGLGDSGEAFRFAEEQGWLPKNASAEDSAKLNGVSLLVMESFGIKGGIFYSLFRNPHYAYRELAYGDIIQGRADPRMDVSGDLLLFLVSRTLFMQEEGLSTTERRDQEQRETLLQRVHARLRAFADPQIGARITRDGVTISLSNIQFQADSAELPESEKAKVKEIAAILQEVSARRLLITGHSALAGTAEGQVALSRERAQAVADYLISLGTHRARNIEVRGYGSEQPIADNSTPEGMALNRRVEITILGRR